MVEERFLICFARYPSYWSVALLYRNAWARHDETPKSPTWKFRPTRTGLLNQTLAVVQGNDHHICETKLNLKEARHFFRRSSLHPAFALALLRQEREATSDRSHQPAASQGQRDLQPSQACLQRPRPCIDCIQIHSSQRLTTRSCPRREPYCRPAMTGRPPVFKARHYVSSEPRCESATVH
jgi:hypothetical protein